MHPIILAHGIARFDILQHTVAAELKSVGVDVDNGDLHYFKGGKDLLVQNGFVVFETSVGFASGVDVRAQQLSDQITTFLESDGSPQVHIIAHSMGGLDARHMIVDIPGMADKVASLTTIGTPHLGTVFADRGLKFGGELLIEALAPVLSLDGFRDLTTDACKAFNERAEAKEADNQVKYQTYSSKEELAKVFLPLQLSWRIINDTEGDNDGLVSVTSQAWVKELTSTGPPKLITQQEFPIPADHLNEVGWWDPNELNGNPFDLKKDKQDMEQFEATIKGVYLKIAQSLQSTANNNNH